MAEVSITVSTESGQSTSRTSHDTKVAHRPTFPIASQFSWLDWLLGRSKAPAVPTTDAAMEAPRPQRGSEDHQPNSALTPTPDAVGAASVQAEPKIFVSHSSTDNDFGLKLVDDLRRALGESVLSDAGDPDEPERDDATVWYDSSGGLLGGDVWWDRIVGQLTRRSIFIIILSPPAVTSAWVRDELRLAWLQKNGTQGKTIIPVIHQACDAPEYLRMVQNVSFLPQDNDYATAFADLLVAIRAGQTTMRDLSATPTFRVGPPFDEGLLPMPERFIGREAELAWVKGRMRQGGATSITAVNGMGGIGKTTLAAVAVHELKWAGRFSQGIVVMNCADKREAADCVTLLRDILVRFDPHLNLPSLSDLATLRDLVGERLTGRDALIVLDNIEPQLPVESLVAPLCEAGLTLLLTARHFLPEAAVPPQARYSLGLLSTADALTLFLQNAGRSTAHDFEGLTAADFDAAKRIVTALERHTLGVKLAGAYAATPGRTLAGVSDEIERDLFDIPEDETPRKVEVVIARSVEALPPDGRRLFVALAAFGTKEFGRKAALWLADALDLPDSRATLDLLVRRALLEAYVDVSLPKDADCERVRVHPLIQLFAQNLFSNAQTLDAARAYTARRAIALWYSDYCARNDSVLVLDEENVTSAFVSAATLRDDDVATKIAMYMRVYWRQRLPLPQAIELLTVGVEAADRLLKWDKSSETLLRKVKIELALGACFMRDGVNQREVDEAAAERQLSHAAGIFQRNLRTRQDSLDGNGIGVVYQLLGDLAFARDKLDDAQTNYQSALSILPEDDRRNRAITQSALGRVLESKALRDGHDSKQQQMLLEQARMFYESALNDQQTYDSLGAAHTHLLLGQLLKEQLGLPLEGRDHLRAAKDLFAGLKHPMEASANALLQLTDADEGTQQ